MMWWYGPGMSGWGAVVMTVSTVLVLLLVVLGVIALVRYLQTPTSAVRPEPEQNRSSPEDVLAERFARGDIDEQEYRTRLDALRSTHPTPRT